MSFDYVRAWKELAKPAFEALPANVRGLYERVCAEAEGLQQGKDLAVTWPEGSDLRTAFEEIPAEELARAARAVYFFGHWSPNRDSYRGSGGTWKFANYADQVLRAKCGFSARERDSHGFHFEIHEGFLRLCLSTERSWQWREIGLATPTTLERARKVLEEGKAPAAPSIEEICRRLGITAEIKDLGWQGGVQNYRVQLRRIGGRSRSLTTPFSCGSAIEPTAVNVLRSLISDAESVDGRDFEKWCSDLGLSTDSRAAEKSYHACVKTAGKLRRFLGKLPNLGSSETEKAFEAVTGRMKEIRPDGFVGQFFELEKFHRTEERKCG